MEHRKQNISLWCSMGLVLILAVGILLLATGTTMARYKKEDKRENTIGIRPLEHIQLGQMIRPENPENPEDTEAVPYFDPTGQGVWTTAGGKCILTFTVANGTGETAYAKQDQQAVIRLAGGLGICGGSGVVNNMYLEVSEMEPQPETDAEEPTRYRATAERIRPNSALYSTYGDGWTFTFLDEDGEELRWLLEGGKLSCLEMTLTLAGTAAEQAAQLQLQITGDYTQK